MSITDWRWKSMLNLKEWWITLLNFILKGCVQSAALYNFKHKVSKKHLLWIWISSWAFRWWSSSTFILVTIKKKFSLVTLNVHSIWLHSASVTARWRFPCPLETFPKQKVCSTADTFKTFYSCFCCFASINTAALLDVVTDALWL